MNHLFFNLNKYSLNKNTLFRVCWIIDMLLLLVSILETILTGSGYEGMLGLLLVVVVSWQLRINRPNWALCLAALPAGILLIFIILVFFLLTGSRNTWQ